MSGPMIFVISKKLLGQPWVSTSGVASGSGLRTWMQCTPTPSMSTTYWGNWLSAASCTRQSYDVRQ